MSLKNTSWRLRAIEKLDSVKPVLQGTSITAVFHGGTLTGTSGCNSYGADATFDDGEIGAISITNLFSTLMNCPTPAGVMPQESDFFEALRPVKKFSRLGTKLRLTDDSAVEKVALVFDLCQTRRVDDLGSTDSGLAGGPISCQGAETRDWYAWNNKMPPKPDDFHIVGEVQVANPGIDVAIIPRVPQGINPKIFLVDLMLRQQPGIWAQVLTWKQVRYDKVMVNSDYESVNVFCGGEVVADVNVDNIQ